MKNNPHTMKSKLLIIMTITMMIVCSGLAQATFISDVLATFTGNMVVTGNTTLQNNVIINTTGKSNTPLTLYGNNESFVQFLVKNTNPSGSADVMTGNDLSDGISTYMNDMGVTNSNFSDINYVNVTPANTSYNLITNSSFVIALGTSGKIIKFSLNSFTNPTFVSYWDSTGQNLMGKNISNITTINVVTINSTTVISNTENISTNLYIPLIRGTPALGAMYYNNTLQVPCWYNGTAWYQANKSNC